MPTARIRVRLTPRSGRSEVSRIEAGVVHARVASPPVDGAANKALIQLLADALAVPKTRIAVKSGAASREKLIEVDGVETEDALARLATAARG